MNYQSNETSSTNPTSPSHIDSTEQNPGIRSICIEEDSWVKLKTSKWFNPSNKDKFDSFFDYQSKEYKCDCFIITDNTSIEDNYSSIKWVNAWEKENSNFEEMKTSSKRFLKENIMVSAKGLMKYIIHCNDHTYVSLRQFKEDFGYNIIRCGDLIKIGKYVLSVKVVKLEEEVSVSVHQDLEHEHDENNKVNTKNLRDSDRNKHGKPFESRDITCRICLRDSSDTPVISICECKGSMKYFHLPCIKEWIRQRCKMKFNLINPSVYKITLEKYSCEICGCLFPIAVSDEQNSKNVFFLVDGLDLCSRFILCSLDQYHQKMVNKNIGGNSHEYYWLNLSNTYLNEITIGRGRNSVFLINDSSISREHCLWKYDIEANVIRWCDWNSKFGTWIKTRGDVEISNAMPRITIQKGNTIYNFMYNIS